jgi:vitamin B12 transporter
MRTILCVLISLCALSLWDAFGNENASEEEAPARMQEIVITATRSQIEILNAPAHVTVITEDEIKQSGVKDLSDILIRQAGIYVHDNGPFGAQKSISIRGSESAQVVVLLNGIRLNDSRQGGTNLANIPVDSIERIEIVRGGTSALYGSDAVGGVVNIITKKEADNKLVLRVENGSYIPQKAVKVYEGPVEEEEAAQISDLFDTQIVSMQFSRKVNNVNVVTAGSFTRANNAFIWEDTAYGKRKRINADFIGGDIYTGVMFPLQNGQLDMAGTFVYNDLGAPGETDPASPYFSTDANQQNTSMIAHIRYTTAEFFSEYLSCDTKVFYKYSGLDFEDPPTPMSSHTLNTVGLDVVQELSAFNFFSLIYGTNILYDTVDSTEVKKKDRFSGGFFLETPLYFFPRFTITPALRYDIYSDFPNSLNFKLSGVYNLSSSTSLKASVAKSYRAPTFNDLYWPEDLWSKGNPDLDPETGYSLEIGLSTIRDKLQFDIYGFARYMINNIAWASDTKWTPTNIGSSFYPGFELNGDLNFLNNFWLNANYTFIYSYLLKGTSGRYTLSDDIRVRYTPVHSLTAGVEYRDGVNLARLEGEFVGKQYEDEANTKVIDSYFVLNAHFKRVLTNKLSLLLSVDNILNNYYESVYDYIMPSLFIRTGIEITL